MASNVLMKPRSNMPQIVTQQSVSSSGTDGSKSDLMNLKPKNDLPSIQSSEQSNSPFSHQVTSMNESKAKQVCKKRPLEVISHTETQLIRCYLNARRFDSSNFSHINVWACGIQLVALNYQTIGRII